MWSYPPAIATTSVNPAGALVIPATFLPQPITVPSFFSATVWYHPAAMALTPTNRERVKLPVVRAAGSMAWSKVAVTVVVGAIPVAPSVGMWLVTVGRVTTTLMLKAGRAAERAPLTAVMTMLVKSPGPFGVPLKTPEVVSKVAHVGLLLIVKLVAPLTTGINLYGLPTTAIAGGAPDMAG